MQTSTASGRAFKLCTHVLASALVGLQHKYLCQHQLTILPTQGAPAHCIKPQRLRIASEVQGGVKEGEPDDGQQRAG